MFIPDIVYSGRQSQFAWYICSENAVNFLKICFLVVKIVHAVSQL